MSQITQEEYIKMSDLLHSENVHEIMKAMCIMYAGGSDHNCLKMLSMVSDIAKSGFKTKEEEVRLYQRCVETVEYMVPTNNYTYPYGMFGVLTYVYCRCNFKKAYLDSQDEFKHKSMLTLSRALQGNPGAKATLPQFVDYIEFCSNNPDWKHDDIWESPILIDKENIKDMVDWCIQNREKWDDTQRKPFKHNHSDVEKQLNLESNGII